MQASRSPAEIKLNLIASGWEGEKSRVNRLGVFDEAAAKVTQDRGQVYGPVADNFDRAARIMAVVDECPDPLARVTMRMIAMKLARLIESPAHLDSWVDIAGYARCGVSVTEPKE